jgi:hypothetical protein
MRFLLLIITSILLSSSFAVQSKMYKWVDDEGLMHFGDKIPQKYLVKEHDVLDDRGMTAKHREAAKTPEQIAEEKRLKEEQQKAEREAEKRRRLDRVLLDAYDSENDLIRARDSRMDDVALQIQLANSNITASNKKIASLEKQVGQIKASNREVPANLYDNLNIEKREVAAQKRIVESNKKRSAEITEKYNGYIKRFRAARLH